MSALCRVDPSVPCGQIIGAAQQVLLLSSDGAEPYARWCELQRRLAACLTPVRLAVNSSPTPTTSSVADWQSQYFRGSRTSCPKSMCRDHSYDVAMSTSTSTAPPASR